MANRRVNITAVAHYVPPEVYDNHFFAERLDTTDEWIRSRTGIVERRIASSGATSDLIIPAALDCLRMRKLTPLDIDCIIVATVTPDYPMPSTAAIVQGKLGAKNAWGFDMSAACSGFVYALVVAAKMIESGACRRVLLCGADRMSTITNPKDRATAVLFSDGAGVVLLESAAEDGIGVLDHVCQMDAEGVDRLYIAAGGSMRPASQQTVADREHCLSMDGQAVFKAAVCGMSSAAAALMERNHLDADSLDWLIPHQANLRIIEAVSKRLQLNWRKVAVNVERFGNTCAASIPICLSEWHQRGAFGFGDALLLVGFGAGFTVGGVLLRWGIKA